MKGLYCVPKIMKMAFILFLFVNVCNSAFSQTLWQTAEYGMSVEQIKKLFPSSFKPSDPLPLDDGMVELLRINNYEIAKHEFNISFAFKDNKLVRVLINYEDYEKLASINEGKTIFYILDETLNAQYGEPEVLERIEDDGIIALCSSWISGKTGIYLEYFSDYESAFLFMSYDRVNINLPEETGTLNIWSFTSELTEIIDNYLKPNFLKPNRPKIQIDYSLIPTERFPGKLDPCIASSQGAPDIFALEASFVRKYVECGLLLDLTDIYEANKSKLLAYPAEIGTYNGKVYAMSWQACPGAMFYRRSLARKYLGTDDPAAVQAYFYNVSNFLETARLLREKSNKSCVVVSSIGDLFQPFLGGRSQPWVVNGKLVIDPAMVQLMDICKILTEEGLQGYAGQWSEEWFAGMKGELRNNSGKQLETFAYFLPTWGLHYIIKPNTPETSGDWAMIQGPLPYWWGGTWLAAYKNSPDAAAAKEVIQYITTNDSFHEAWARNTGDIVSNTVAIDRIKNNYREPFLGGQNYYAAFAQIAKNINGKLAQSTDFFIESLFRDALDAYLRDEKTKYQTLADFGLTVYNKLGYEQ